MGSLRGTGGTVYAAIMDGSGNLYIGGQFTNTGSVLATNVAKWNGSGWLPTGAGLNNKVSALALSGTNVYAGGTFTTAGGHAANHIAQWNGSSWSPLGAGMNNAVNALIVSGGTLYAGGDFTTATNSGNAAVRVNCTAQWNRVQLAPLGRGHVGGDLYRPTCMPWRHREPICMPAAISRRREATRPLILRNGTVTVGRRWIWAWVAQFPKYRRWRCRQTARFCMPVAISRWRAATRPIILHNGMAPIGRLWLGRERRCCCAGYVG